MKIFKDARALHDHIAVQKSKGVRVGFVPTMGALHQGHLSLIDSAGAACGLTVCSIFVNPTQFNNQEDFRHYPVTIEKDIEALIGAGCHILFLPDQDQIYPPGYVAPHYDLGSIEDRLEGFYRPGHFQGVCQVVDRLLDIVAPDDLFMGQKDFQQCMVVKKLLELTGKIKTIHLHISATIREKDGLAMSSRNLRLTEAQRSLAAAIFAELVEIKSQMDHAPLPQLKQAAIENLSRKGFAVDYVEIAHADTLEPAEQKSGTLVALAAASVGSIRLIDNLYLN